MKAVTIPRIVAQYHDDAVAGNPIASATGIRKSFFESDTLGAVTDFIPDTTREVLHDWQTETTVISETGHLSIHSSVSQFCGKGQNVLPMIADVTEGIENLLYRAAANNGTFEGFMNEVKSKRYTWTRLQRMLTHIFTGFTYDIRSRMKTPSYLRLLGMTSAGRLYLNEHKKRLKLPLVSKAAAFSNPSLEFRYPCIGYVRTWNRKRDFQFPNRCRLQYTPYHCSVKIEKQSLVEWKKMHCASY